MTFDIFIIKGCIYREAGKKARHLKPGETVKGVAMNHAFTLYNNRQAIVVKSYDEDGKVDKKKKPTEVEEEKIAEIKEKLAASKPAKEAKK